MDEVDDLARTDLRVVVDASCDGGAADVGVVCDFNHRFPCRCAFGDIEIEVLEVAQVTDGISFIIHIQGVVLAFGLAVAAVKAHDGIHVPCIDVDRIAIGSAVKGVAAGHYIEAIDKVALRVHQASIAVIAAVDVDRIVASITRGSFPANQGRRDIAIGGHRIAASIAFDVVSAAKDSFCCDALAQGNLVIICRAFPAAQIIIVFVKSA